MINQKISFSILILLAFSGLGFASDDQIIYTWGYGDLMVEALNAVKDILVPNNFGSAFKLAFLIGLVFALFVSIGLMGGRANPFYLIKFWFVALFAYYLFMQIKIPSMVVKDLVNGDAVGVSNVPWAIGFPLSLFSNLEYKLANKMESSFTIPNELKYSSSGLGLGLSTLNQATMHRIVDPLLYLSLNDYILDCVIPDILEGTKDPSILINSKNLWNDLGNVNGARITKEYTNTYPAGTLIGCTSAYGHLTTRLNSYTSPTGLGMRKIGDTLGGLTGSAVSSYLGVSSDFFTKYSTVGQSFLLQSIAMNSLGESYSNWAKVNGISGDSLVYGLAKARETASHSMAISGSLGKQFVPVIKGIITIILVSLTPILTLLLLTPLSSKVAIGYITSLLWLSLWHIGDIILNFMVNVKASSFITDITTNSGNYTIQTAPVVMQSTVDYINLISSYYWLIPLISLLIVSGFSVYTMNSLASSSSTGANTGGSAGSETATGSASLGNVSLGNTTANTRSTANSVNVGRTGSLSRSFTQTTGNTSLNNTSTTTGTYKGHNLSNKGIQNYGQHISNDAKAVKTALSSVSTISGDTTVVGNSQLKPDGSFFLASGTNIVDNNSGLVYTVDKGGVHLQKNKDGSYGFYGGGVTISGKGENADLIFDSNGKVIGSKGMTKTGVQYSTFLGSDGEMITLDYGGYQISTDGNGNIKEAKLAKNSNVQQDIGQKLSKDIQSFNSGLKKLESGKGWSELTKDEQSSLISTAFTARNSYLSDKQHSNSFTTKNLMSSLQSTAEQYNKGGKKAVEEGHRVNDEQNEQIKMYAEAGTGINVFIARANAITSTGEVRINGSAIFAKAEDGHWYKYEMTDSFKKDWQKNFEKSTSDALFYKNTKDHSISNTGSNSRTGSNATSISNTQAVSDFKDVGEKLNYGKSNYLQDNNSINTDKMPDLVQGYVQNLREKGDDRTLDAIIKDDLTPSGKNYDNFHNYVETQMLGEGTNNLRGEIEGKTANIEQNQKQNKEAINNVGNDINKKELQTNQNIKKVKEGVNKGYNDTEEKSKLDPIGDNKEKVENALAEEHETNIKPKEDGKYISPEEFEKRKQNAYEKVKSFGLRSRISELIGVTDGKNVASGETPSMNYINKHDWKTAQKELGLTNDMKEQYESVRSAVSSYYEALEYVGNQKTQKFINEVKKDNAVNKDVVNHIGEDPSIVYNENYYSQETPPEKKTPDKKPDINPEPRMTIGEKLEKDENFKNKTKAVENLATIGGNSYNRLIKQNYNEKNGNMDYRFGVAYSILQKNNQNPNIRKSAIEDIKEGYRQGKFSDKDIEKLNLSDEERKNITKRG